MKKVMLVEDEKTIRAGLKILLEEVITGYRVLWEAENGKRASEIIAIDIPDLVITDIRMPEMTGLKFITLLKTKYPQVPVIVISGYDDFAYVREALKLGVKDYLLKPINRKELADILGVLFNEGNVNRTPEDLGSEPLLIRNIKELIHKNLGNDLSLNFISSALSMHPNYISQQFSLHTEMRLSDYIVNQRMEAAKHLLVTTNLKIYDIAHLTGYKNPKHFSSVFKKVNGRTPQEYREGPH